VAVPDFQSLMRPVLELLSDGADHDVKSIRAELADRYSLSREGGIGLDRTLLR
jgi:restriction endonuclease Mrr